MRRRDVLGAAVASVLGVSSVPGRRGANRGTDSSAGPTHPRVDSGAGSTQPRADSSADREYQPGDSNADRTHGSEDRRRGGAISSVTVDRRGLEVEFASRDSATELHLVYDDAVVFRRRVWADQSAVSIDLYGVEVSYRDSTYRGSGYRPGRYTLVAYDRRTRVDEVDVTLVHGLAIEAVTAEPVRVAGGPAMPHLVYELTNPGSGPTYVHEIHYREARNATGVIENPDSGDLYAEGDHRIQVLPATGRSGGSGDGSDFASPPLGHHGESEPGNQDIRHPRYLAPGETRRFLGPPVGDTYHDSDDPGSMTLEPESLSPAVTVECVGGNTGPQDPTASADARAEFAALRADHLDAVTVRAYDLGLSARNPTVTDEWGFYADVTVRTLRNTGTWRQ